VAERWPVWRMMAGSEAPAMAAVVAAGWQRPLMIMIQGWAPLLAGRPGELSELRMTLA
jgi:hypothetical protein